MGEQEAAHGVGEASARRCRTSWIVLGAVLCGFVGVFSVSLAGANGDVAVDPAAGESIPIGFCDLVEAKNLELGQSCSETAFETSLDSGRQVASVDTGGPSELAGNFDPGYGPDDLAPPDVEQDTPPLTEPIQSTSPSAHDDASPSEAKQLFAGTFAPLLDSLGATAMPDDSDVVAYPSRTSAIVDPGPGAPNQLIDSTVPLTPSTGSEHPIDLGVEATADGFVVERPLVDVALPEVSTQGTELSASGVGMAYEASADVDASTSNGSRVDGQGVFYAEADTDTDLFVAPRVTGFEMFAQLRSAQSPQTLRFEIDLPSAATLEADSSGAFNVTQDGKPIAQVTPPAAIDATGAPMPMNATVDGDAIRVDVAHGADDAYPILVDPEIVDLYDWPAGSSFDGWVGYGNDPDYLRTQWSSYFTPGLYNQAPAGRIYDAGSLSLWHYPVPHLTSTDIPTSYIADAFFGDAQFASGTGAVKKPRMVLGLWSRPNNGWVRMLDWQSSFSTSVLSLATWAPLQAGMSATEAKRLDFQLYVPAGGGAATPTDTKTGRVSNVAVHLTDPEAPTVAAMNSGAWSDGAREMSVDMEAFDPGLGIKGQTFVPGWVSEETLHGGIDTINYGCDGTPRSPCSQETGDSYQFIPDDLNLSEGLQGAFPVVWDALGQGTIASSYYGVDRTPPDVMTIEPLADGGIRVEAEDGEVAARNTGDPHERATAESGIVRMELLGDDGVIASAEQQCVGDGIDGNGDPTHEIPWQSCAMDHTFDIADRTLATAVRITDAVGNQTTQQIDWTAPSIELSGPLAEADGQPLPSDTASLAVDLVDDGPGATGNKAITILIGDEAAFHKDFTCEPICQATAEVDYTYARAQWGAGEHELTIVSEDEAGNSSELTLLVDAQANAPRTCSGSAEVQPAGDVVSPAEAAADAPEAVFAPAEPVSAPELDATLDPELTAAPDEDALSTEGTVATDLVNEDVAGGILLQSGVCMTPSQTTSAESAPELIGTEAAVLANTSTDTDTVIRPIVGGFTLVLNRRATDAPLEFTWDLSTEGRAASIEALSEGGVAVVDPTTSPDPSDDDVDLPPEPSAENTPDVLADPQAQLDWTDYEAAAAATETGHDILMAIPAPYSVNSAGEIVPATVTSATGDTVTVSAPAGSKTIYITVMKPLRNCGGQKHLSHYDSGAPNAGLIVTYWGPIRKCVDLGDGGVFGKYRFKDKLPGVTYTLNGQFILRLKADGRVVRAGEWLVGRRSPFVTRTKPNVKWQGTRHYCAHLYQRVSNGGHIEVWPIPSVRKCAYWYQ